MIPLLFLGSAPCGAVFLLSLPYIERVIPVFDDIFWLEFMLGVVSEGIRDALVGFAALGLSFLMTRNPTKQTVPA